MTWSFVLCVSFLHFWKMIYDLIYINVKDSNREERCWAWFGITFALESIFDLMELLDEHEHHCIASEYTIVGVIKKH